jgi:hypothetical protein
MGHATALGHSITGHQRTWILSEKTENYPVRPHRLSSPAPHRVPPRTHLLVDTLLVLSGEPRLPANVAAT